MNLDDLRSFANRVKEKRTGLGKYAVAKVVGVTFDNRQEVLNSMTENTKVRLVRDRSNPHDFFAIEVRACIEDEWCMAGFIPKTISKNMAVELDKGTELSTSVLKVTGDDSLRGLLIRIER